MLARQLSDLKLGSELGFYEIVRPIVPADFLFEAVDKRTGKIVFLKAIPTNQEFELIQYYQSKLGRLRHRHISAVLSIEHAGSIPVVISEFVPGVTFRQMTFQHALSSVEGAPLFLQMLEALKGLHAVNVSLCGLQPEDVILQPLGEIKILNPILRLSRIAQSNYIAPERTTGTKPNVRSDLWTLGAIFYESMVGLKMKDPNRAPTFGVRADACSDVVFPEATLSWIPPEMRSIIVRLCNRNPSDRYQSVDECMDEISDFQSSRIPLPRENYVQLAQHLMQRQAEPGLTFGKFDFLLGSALIATAIFFMAFPRQATRLVSLIHHSSIPQSSGSEELYWAPNGRSIASVRK